MTSWQVALTGALLGTILGLLLDVSRKVDRIYAALKRKGDIE